MNIFMAIITADPDLPEVPFFLFLMAGKTWSCKMGSLQFEICCIMLIGGKRRFPESPG